MHWIFSILHIFAFFFGLVFLFITVPLHIIATIMSNNKKKDNENVRESLKEEIKKELKEEGKSKDIKGPWK